MSKKFVFGGSFTSVVPLLLDLYPNAAAAYSVRKLRTAYTGACIRVRRSSDNAEQDIGFSGNDLDTAALLAFVGSGNGFVTTWYDQSGNGLNLTQPTAGTQMRIVNSGVLEIEPTTNKVGIRGLFANQTWMTAGNVLNIGGNSMVSFGLGNLTSPNSATGFYGKTVATGFPGRYALLKEANNIISLVQRSNGAVTNAIQSGIGADTQKLYNQSVILNDANRLFVNNVNVATNTNSSNITIGASTWRFIVGSYSNSNDTAILPNFWYDRWLQELIIYIGPSTNLPTINDVNTLINNYYNVY
jgi:hypothetical protein